MARTVVITPILIKVITVGWQRHLASTRIRLLVIASPNVTVVCRDIENTEPLPQGNFHMLVPGFAAVLRLDDLSFLRDRADSGFRKRRIGVTGSVWFQTTDKIIRRAHEKVGR